MISPLTPAFSLEFFPPRDAAAQQRLVDGAKQMMVIEPHYVSVTFGAGGSTRDGTLDTVRTMRGLGCDAAPHLSCIGSSREELRALLQRYRDEGVRRIVALRGDMPSGMGASAAGALHHASDLVEFIRQETGDWFHIEVAAYPEMHPQASGPEKDLEHFIHKVRAGANSAITQYFFNADAYFDTSSPVFLGGSCTLFCNTNLFYNVKVWGDINSVPPQPNCLENKPTFECHPQLNNVIDKIKNLDENLDLFTVLSSL
jgi:methylenetetrahydrofolate reductase (NADPH)